MLTKNDSNLKLQFVAIDTQIYCSTLFDVNVYNLSF